MMRSKEIIEAEIRILIGALKEFDELYKRAMKRGENYSAEFYQQSTEKAKNKINVFKFVLGERNDY